MIALLATWEGLGILVFNREIPLQMVDDFYSGTVAQSWRKLQRYVEELREVSSRPTDWEWFPVAGRKNGGRGISEAACSSPCSASQLEAHFLNGSRGHFEGAECGRQLKHGVNI